MTATLVRCDACYDPAAETTAHGEFDLCGVCLDRHRAGGICDWCETPVAEFAIVSTAGARCDDCHTYRGLCGWCGEAPDDGEGYCDDCATERA